MILNDIIVIYSLAWLYLSSFQNHPLMGHWSQ